MEMSEAINWIVGNWWIWVTLIVICGGYNLLIGINIIRNTIRALFGKTTKDQMGFSSIKFISVILSSIISAIAGLFLLVSFIVTIIRMI